MSSRPSNAFWTRSYDLVHSVVSGWALLGGAILACLVASNVASVLGALVWRSIPGDVELTEVGIAVAVFSFLPIAQLTGSNVTAEIFTAKASKRVSAFFELLASVVALAFSLLLFYRMVFGMLDQKAYQYATTVLRLPIWPFYIPILISLGLLAVSALVNLGLNLQNLRKTEKND